MVKIIGASETLIVKSLARRERRRGTKDTIDIVAHSMGYAYSLGLIEKLITMKDKIHLGRFYILAPEGAGNTHSIDFSIFEEVWQYGSDLGRTDGQPTDPIFNQDGIAPQADIPNINNKGIVKIGGRVFIPNSESKGFITSHLSGNYGWIFKQEEGQNGFVKTRK